jgi:hypothetical protein
MSCSKPRLVIKKTGELFYKNEIFYINFYICFYLIRLKVPFISVDPSFK